jgi:hypothetical protein
MNKIVDNVVKHFIVKRTKRLALEPSTSHDPCVSSSYFFLSRPSHNPIGLALLLIVVLFLVLVLLFSPAL